MDKYELMQTIIEQRPLLVFLHGLPGTGKSTFIKENKLERYTLSLDQFRLLAHGPELDEKGINQDYTKFAAKIMNEIVEERMKKKEFIILDGTYLKNEDIDSYKSLIKQYQYEFIVLNFDISLEKALEWNKNRETLKQVPDDVIRKLNERRKQQDLSKYKVFDSKEFNRIMEYPIHDYSDKKVNVFGDIHSCYEPLEHFFKDNPYNENEVYIFLGDYLDRGKQSKETMEFLLKLSEKPNVIFLEGNHERWIKKYLDKEEIGSKEFLINTLPEIKDIDRQKLRTFTQRLRQAYMFKKGDDTYLLTHGGLNTSDVKIAYVPKNQLIKGVGGYERDIDKEFKENSNGLKQIHGHRSLNINNDGNEISYNLEGAVERGGFLKVMTIDKDVQIKRYENNYQVQTKDFFNNHLIQIKDLGILNDGRRYFSCNFTRDAFFDKQWNDLSVKARGLFLATNFNGSHDVIARSYDKFFNRNEIEESSPENYLKRPKSQVVCYLKENGFLGIVSSIDNELHYFSKSTDKGEYAQMVKDGLSTCNLEKLNTYLKENNATAVFEVINIEKDPHIIEYPESKVVLLDIIKNDLTFQRLPFQELNKVAKEFDVECKRIVGVFKDWQNFEENQEKLLEKMQNKEGFVAQDQYGFMIKCKTPYYLELKHLRTLMEAVKNDKEPHTDTYEEKDFVDWVKQCKKEQPELIDNIIEAYKEYSKETKFIER